MSKISLILLLVAVADIAQGAPATFEEIIEAAKARNWDQLQYFVNQQLGPNAEWKPDFNNIRNLQAPQGGQVYGEAEYSFQSSSNIDGKTSHDSGGHKVVNENGKVDEFDFKPTDLF